MAKKIAVLEYTFVFSPGLDTWTTAVDFENHQNRFLASVGLKGEIVSSNNGNHYIFISPMDKLDNMVKGPQKVNPNKLKEMAKKGLKQNA